MERSPSGPVGRGASWRGQRGQATSARSDCCKALQCCVALVSFLVLTAAAVAATKVVQDLTGETDDTTLFVAGLLVALGGLLVLYDWSALGPTMALQSGAVAAATAWLLVVPLALVSLAFEEQLPIVGYAALGVGTAVVLGETCGIAGALLGLAVAVAAVIFTTAVDSLIADQVGVALLFMAVYWMVRKALGLRRIEQWPGVTEVEPGTTEYSEIVNYFHSCEQSWAHKYDFRLRVMNIYQFGRSQKFRAGAGLLFHGTTWESALAIVCDGFRLPKHPGMFGKGIYFADCPLKSYQYTRAGLGECTGCLGRGGLILMCPVRLGNTRPERAANAGLSGYNRNSLWACLTFQTGAYDSVVGVEAEQGGALRVPEYVVYDPAQAALSYIVEVSRISQ